MGLAARRIGATPGGGVRFELVAPTDLGLVGDIVEAVVDCCRHCGPLSNRARFRIRTVAAEAVANAMLYGNRCDPSLEVTVELSVTASMLVLSVIDQGPGFDPESVPELSEQECHEAQGGRGLFMIRRLADRVEFSERGNAIWMTLPLN